MNKLVERSREGPIPRKSKLGQKLSVAEVKKQRESQKEMSLERRQRAKSHRFL